MIEIGDGRKTGPGGLLFFLEANMQVPQSSESLRGRDWRVGGDGGALNQSAEGLRGVSSNGKVKDFDRVRLISHWIRTVIWGRYPEGTQEELRRDV
jgi:hypothetical protein